MLFPLPFRPTIPNISPFCTSNETSWTARSSSKSLEAKRVKGPLFEGVDLEARNAERLADASNHDRRRPLGVERCLAGGRCSAETVATAGQTVATRLAAAGVDRPYAIVLLMDLLVRPF